MSALKNHDMPQSIGQRLRTARRRKRLRISDAESRLKIRREYLEALEQNRFGELPGLAYVKQFLKAYATFLSLAPEELLAQLRLVSIANRADEPIVPNIQLHQPKIFITPRLILGVGVSLIFLGIFGYIGYQVKQFSRPPRLEIQSPKDGLRVITGTIDVTGSTSPGAVVTINGEVVAQQTNGQFTQSVQLAEGVNALHIVAKNRFQKQSEQHLNVIKPRTDEQSALSQ